MPILMIVAGAFCTLFGGLLIWAYIWKAIIVPWGEPDQSLMFWYLIFPLFGLPFLSLGIPLIIVEFRNRKKNRT